MSPLTRRTSRARQEGRAAVTAIALIAALAAGFGVAAFVFTNPLGLGWLPRGDAAGDEHAHGARQQLWTCGMHPEVLQDEPGICPICHMELTPVAMQGPDETDPHAGGEPGADPGRPVVRIDSAIVQNMGVTTAPVERRDLSRVIRAVGYTEFDQEKMVTVTTKYSGFVEKVHANYIGQAFRRGQPLFEIYSPDLVQTQQELLSAIRYVSNLEDAHSDAWHRAKALADAARQRLRYWDITDGQIRQIEESGRVMRSVTVYSPSSGVVMKRREGLEGAEVRPGMDVIHLADLSTLWLRVEIFEDQLVWIEPGAEAEVSLTYFPGETIRGRVLFVEPELSEKTRTARLTLRIANPSGRLRAGMYATVVFRPLARKDALVVPTQAVLRTGMRDLVVIALGDGRFRPRPVRLGLESDAVTEVLEGVEAGETVVTSAQFLIDSESNLRAAIESLAAPAAGHAGH